MLLVCLLGLSACRSDRVSIDPKDPDSPQFAYRKDELALLQMAADDIQELERDKRYGAIYDDYASDNFRKSVGRRQFMIMSNCVESFLGDLQEYDRNDIGFRREFIKDKNGRENQREFVDVLNRKVQRVLGSLEEQLVFVPNGLSFQLNGLYWISKDKPFLECVAQSGRLDAETAPAPPPNSSEPATTPSVSSEGANATETTPSQTKASSTPNALERPNNVVPNGTASPASGGSAASVAPTPATQTVQPMRPAEIKKSALNARPAGAGAVVDQRPNSAKTGEEKKAEEEAKKRRRLELPEETETQITVPLPTSPGSDD